MSINFEGFERVAICGELISNEEEDIKLFEEYKRKNGKALQHTVWLDKRNKVLFGADENYENTAGPDTIFLSKPDKYLVHPKGGLLPYQNIAKAGYPFSDIQKDSDFICEKTKFTESVKGKSILIFGSGPSSKTFDKKTLSEYDQIWVNNDVYKSENLKSISANLYYISNEMQGLKETIDYINGNKELVCCFDTTVHRDIGLTLKYKKSLLERFFLFSTRLFTTIGCSQRLIAMAAHLGASKISFIGVDGKLESEFEEEKCYTSYGNTRKDIPAGHSYHSQNREYILFWEYMMENFPHDIEFENLGFEYKGNITAKMFNSPTFTNDKKICSDDWEPIPSKRTKEMHQKANPRGEFQIEAVIGKPPE